MFPTVAGADVVAYNLAALKDKAPLILDGTDGGEHLPRQDHEVE